MVVRSPNFGWQVLEVERVARLLKTFAGALDAHNIPYAVIGGNAVAAWVARRDAGAVRATKDVDVLLRRSDLARAAEALSPLGYDLDEVIGIPVFLDRADPLPSQGVHVIFAGERIRPRDDLAAPDVDGAIRAESGFLVIDLPSLVRMKLMAYRRVDQVHLEDLLRVGLIDADLARGLPPDLLARLREIRDTMEWFTPPPRF
ncbi:MAG: hypothetical protein U1D55_17055 [Phycisphaerae bacterium]